MYTKAKMHLNYTSVFDDTSDEPNLPHAKHWCCLYLQFRQ